MRVPALLFILFVLATTAAWAEGEVESPWLALPIVSSNPKLGTSAGALGAYLHRFDPDSRVSMFGLAAQYSSTGSLVAGAFAKTSSGKDHHRAVLFAGGGRVENDYEDFLGTGVPLQTEDKLWALAGRYLNRFRGSWFAGGQGSFTNYQILGQSTLEDQALTVLGLTGFQGGSLGAVLYWDSRDDENMPVKGWLLNLNNLAYREWMGAGADFDVYRADLRFFLEHGRGHVLGLRQNNQWTVDAPAAAYAPVTLRGYKFGQYLGQRMSSLEAEERLHLAERWTVNAFAGVASLYGGQRQWNDHENLYVNGGVGVQFILKPEEKSLAALEYAKGEGDNEGVYLRLGYAF